MAIKAKEFGILLLILTVTLLTGYYNKGLARSLEEEKAMIEGAEINHGKPWGQVLLCHFLSNSFKHHARR